MIKLTIVVDDLGAVLDLFTHIRIYSSPTEDGTYESIGYTPLVAGQTGYNFYDADGTATTWYKASYWSTTAESSQSDAVQGSVGTLYHYATYAPEIGYGGEDQKIIRLIRRYIGDQQKLDRVYIDDEDSSCSYIGNDDRTVDMGMRGWPAYIQFTPSSGIPYEKTNLTDPYVQGYRYLTFSGILDSDIAVVDIWFYSSKFSDREIYEAYGDSQIPAGLTADNVTVDHLVLQASIDLMENMTWEDMVDDGAAIRDDNSFYDPSAGLRERDKAIKRLRKQLDALVKQYMFVGMGGVRLD